MKIAGFVLDARTLAAYLDGLRVEHEAGDQRALMSAIWLCLDAGRPVPPWAAEPFLRAISRWHGGQAATLDAALGFKPATPKRTAARRLARMQMLQAFHAMRADRLAHPDEAIGAATFERIGRQFGMSAATAKRRYYAAKKDAGLRAESPSWRALNAALLGPITRVGSAERAIRERLSRKRPSRKQPR